MPLALPSIGDAVTAAQRTARRFPLPLLSAAVAATAAILTAEEIGRDWLHVRLLASAALGMPLFTALALFAERLKRRGAGAALALAGLLVLAGFFAGYDFWSKQILLARFLQLGAASCLLVVLLPFARRGIPNAFWQFVVILFQRAVLAAAFALVLFLALSLALAAADNLFGVPVAEQGYFRLWVLCGIVFGPWFFLGGVPEDIEGLEFQREYPPAIRVLAQYVLVPLAAGYLVILTLYLLKVVVTWDWPSGWIGNLVSGVAVAGIAAIVLTYPASESGERPWVAAFARQFWFAILPSLAMLWLALYQRVHQYGFTEPRYVLLALSVWVAGLAVFYLVTRSRNLLVMPASLAVLAVATLAGPWGPFARSEASQVARARAVLERNGMFEGGVARRPARPVSDADREALSGAVRYLVEVHGTDAMASWFADSVVRRAVVRAGIQGRLREDEGERWADTVLAHLGLRYRRPQLRAETVRFAYQAPGAAAVPLREFDVLVPLVRAAESVPDTGYAATWTAEPLAVRVTRGADTLFAVPLDSAFARIRALDIDRSRAEWERGRIRPKRVRGLTPDLFRVDAAGAAGRARVLVDWIEGLDSAGVARVERVVGRVLVGRR